jgi:hypothetical protein
MVVRTRRFESFGRNRGEELAIAQNIQNGPSVRVRGNPTFELSRGARLNPALQSCSS